MIRRNELLDMAAGFGQSFRQTFEPAPQSRPDEGLAMQHDYHVGQPVIYGTLASGSGRAEDLAGEIRYWGIDGVAGDGTLILRTEDGRQHVVSAADPSLRPATKWERFWHRKRFPQPIVP